MGLGKLWGECAACCVFALSSERLEVRALWEWSRSVGEEVVGWVRLMMRDELTRGRSIAEGDDVGELEDDDAVR